MLHTVTVALLPDVLDAGDVELQRVRLDVSDAMCEASVVSFDELHKWMTWARDVPTRESVAEYLRRAETEFVEDCEWGYVLVEKSTGEIVGGAAMGINDDDRDCPEIGYWVRTDRTGRGYASTAASALADAAFRYLPVDHVKIRMDQANAPSVAVAQRIGFRLLGEEDRPKETPGHSGRGYIWVLDREHLR